MYARLGVKALLVVTLQMAKGWRGAEMWAFDLRLQYFNTHSSRSPRPNLSTLPTMTGTSEALTQPSSGLSAA